MKLYEFPDWMQSVLSKSAKQGGQITPEIQQELDEVDLAYEEKLRRTLEVKRSFDLQADMCAQEIKRLQARKKAAEGQSEGLKNYVLHSMQVMDRKEIDFGTFKVSRYETAGSIVPLCMSEIPKNFLRATLKVYATVLPAKWLKQAELVIDRNMVKRALKAGEIVPGVEVQIKETIRIT